MEYSRLSYYYYYYYYYYHHYYYYYLLLLLENVNSSFMKDLAVQKSQFYYIGMIMTLNIVNSFLIKVHRCYSSLNKSICKLAFSYYVA